MISALRRNHCRSRNTLLSLNAHARDFARRSMLSKAAKKRFVDFSLKSPREKAMALLAPLLLAGTLSFCFYSLLVDDKHIKFLKEGYSRQKKPIRERLLPELVASQLGAKTVVLNLEGTLMSAEYNRTKGWSYSKRPCVDKFLLMLARMGYEVVVFSSEYGQSTTGLIGSLDPNNAVAHWLFREHSSFVKGNVVKDLSYLGRDVKNVIVVDSKAEHFLLHPENGVVVKPYNRPDPEDREICRLMSLFTYIRHKKIDDLRDIVRNLDNAMQEAENYVNREQMRRVKQHKRNIK